MRILFIGDPHLKLSNWANSQRLVKQTIELAKKLKPELIINLGDTLDLHAKIQLRVLCLAKKWFLDLANIAPTIILIGNHDREDQHDFMSDIHPFVGLKHENLSIVSKTQIIKGILCVPYVPVGKFAEAVKDFDVKKCKLVVAHQEMYGCKMNGLTSTTGDKWPADYPLLICGHIHGYQRMKNVWYVGTPMQQNFSEMEDKSVSLITLGKEVVEERIKLKMIVRKNLIFDYSEWLKYKYEKITDMEIKIKIKVTMAQRKTIIKSKKYLNLVKEVKIDLLHQRSLVDKLSLNKKKLSFHQELLKIIDEKEKEILVKL